MTSQAKGIEKLSVKRLFSKNDRYIIPIYQRNYAWGEYEVAQLIDDISRHEKGHYYLGSLTVKWRDDGSFEVIDGQQRLTTLFLLLSVLEYGFGLDLSFEHRQDSSDELNDAKFGREINGDGQIAKIYRYLKNDDKKLFENKGHFLDKLLNQVRLIRTEIPKNTDLNQYFERMNNRGEQLEHHEVIKAKLMSKLADDEKMAFATIWNACSDMNRYVVTAFGAGEREKLFKNGDGYFYLYENFKDFKDKIIKNTDKQNDNDGKKLKDILTELTNNTKPAKSDTKDDDKPKSFRFDSVIDFPNFLAQVLYLFLKKKNKISADTHRLDEKNLIGQFEQSKLSENADDIKEFAVHLLNLRLLFDRHVIKFDGQDDKNDWYVYQFKGYENGNDKKSYNFVNVFGAADDEQIKMLQTMFHYSFPSRNYKYWLFAYLKWLDEHCEKLSDANRHIKFFEKLCDKFYFNRFYQHGEGDEYFDIIYDADDKILDLKSHDFLHQGTKVQNFIFNRLDYILWCKDKNKFKNFKFTARNSVEHYYPQNPPEGNEVIDNIHHFGNLCLITHSQNSSLNNKMPAEKKAGYAVQRYASLSLKQKKMLEYDTWTEHEINAHGEAMIELLNNKISQ